MEEGEAWPWQCRRNATPAHEEHCMYVCMSVCPNLLRVWLYVCHLLIVKPAVCVGKPSVRATSKLCFAAPVEVIRKNVSCAFTASQVCVTVVGFGFTLRQTSSLYGYGNREKRPTVARGPGEYSSMATSVILESTWCNYPVAGTQRSRPLPSSTLEPKAPLFISTLVLFQTRSGRVRKQYVRLNDMGQQPPE